MLSNEQYVEDHGNYCPNCESPNVVVTSMVHFDNERPMNREISCLRCGTKWLEFYAVTGYEIVK